MSTNRLIGLLCAAGLCSVMLAACATDGGECTLREENAGAGVGGGVISPTGAGGYGVEPPDDVEIPEPDSEPLDVGDSEPIECKDPEVKCTVRGSGACVDQCAAIGAYCVELAQHPHSPSSGIGELYWCKGGRPSYTCSYVYKNGDNCTRLYLLKYGIKWYCLYEGGAK